MKIIGYIVLFLTLVSCTQNATETRSSIVINHRRLYLYVIDSCEYYGEIEGSKSDFLTHKGNCKNHK